MDLAIIAEKLISKCCLQNVLDVADIEYYLIWVSNMDKKAVPTTFRKSCCRIAKGRVDILTGSLLGFSY